MAVVESLLFFLFSSRRRHTRCALVTGRRVLFRSPTRRCCSSLARLGEPLKASGLYAAVPGRAGLLPSSMAWSYAARPSGYWEWAESDNALASVPAHSGCRLSTGTGAPCRRILNKEIGRASCRERVCRYG